MESLQERRGRGSREPEQHLRSLIEGRDKSFSRPFPSTCAHLHAHTHQLICRGRQAYGLHRHIHTDVGTHTESRDAIPLPYSEKEAWIQILGSYQHTDTNTCVHTSLWCVMQKMREKRV